jgi:hypothetical protein
MGFLKNLLSPKLPAFYYVMRKKRPVTPDDGTRSGIYTNYANVSASNDFPRRPRFPLWHGGIAALIHFH